MEIFPLLQLKLRFKIVHFSKTKYFLIYCKDNQIYICKNYKFNCQTLPNYNILNYTHFPIHSNKINYLNLNYINIYKIQKLKNSLE